MHLGEIVMTTASPPLECASRAAPCAGGARRSRARAPERLSPPAPPILVPSAGRVRNVSNDGVAHDGQAPHGARASN
eukprot:931140-Pyramimonas_sp.AAC.1